MVTSAAGTFVIVITSAASGAVGMEVVVTLGKDVMVAAGNGVVDDIAVMVVDGKEVDTGSIVVIITLV